LAGVPALRHYPFRELVTFDDKRSVLQLQNEVTRTICYKLSGASAYFGMSLLQGLNDYFLASAQFSFAS